MQIYISKPHKQSVFLQLYNCGNNRVACAIFPVCEQFALSQGPHLFLGKSQTFWTCMSFRTKFIGCVFLWSSARLKKGQIQGQILSYFLNWLGRAAVECNFPRSHLLEETAKKGWHQSYPRAIILHYCSKPCVRIVSAWGSIRHIQLHSQPKKHPEAFERL